MTPRARRLASTALLIVLSLYGGKWLTGFLAARWWAASISPDAVAAVTAWQIRALTLDFIAVLIASAWFAVQVMMVTSTINVIHVRRRLGNRVEWYPVPQRLLIVGAIALGVLLGLLTGAGARAWLGPILLAQGNPHLGVLDPVLGIDVGTLVSVYPVLALLHRFWVTLAVLGIALTLLLYMLVDSAAGHAFRPVLRPERRIHYGMLLAVLALALMAGAMLTPMHLATGIDVPLGDAIRSTRLAAGYIVAGVALATTILTCCWALFRARDTVLLGGWLVLALTLLAARTMVPAFTADSGNSAERAQLMRQFDTLMYGIALAEQSLDADTLPGAAALWEPEILSRWSSVNHGTLIGAGAAGADSTASWLIATVGTGDSTIRVARISATDVGPHGAPREIGTVRTVTAPRSLPGQHDWGLVRGGVRVGGILRRAAIAWALQAPGILALDHNAEIDWWLDPRDRARVLVPTLTWRAVGMAWNGGNLVWILSGLAAIDRAPLSTRVAFGSGTVAGVLPALVAVVSAGTGSVDFYVDPAADSLGAAWGRSFSSVVRSSQQLPAELRSVLPYPMEWFERQLTVLTQPHWNIGVPPTGRNESTISQTWAPGPGALQTTLDAPDATVTTAILTAVRNDLKPEIRISRAGTKFVVTASGLMDTWRQSPVLAHIRDSVVAAGDSLLSGPMRWHNGAAGQVAWQPFVSVGERGAHLAWLGTMTPERIGGGRDFRSAWQQFEADSDSGTKAPAASRLTALRTWIVRADSALVRGDLTAFARAWEAIRAIMLDPSPE